MQREQHEARTTVGSCTVPRRADATGARRRGRHVQPPTSDTSPRAMSGIDGVRSSYDGMRICSSSERRARSAVRREDAAAFGFRARHMLRLQPEHVDASSTAGSCQPRGSHAGTIASLQSPARSRRLPCPRATSRRARSSRRRGCARCARPPTSSATVWLPSIMRAMRIQVVYGNCRSAGAGTSARSNATRPKPPAWSTRFSAFNARSALAASRGSRAAATRSTPAAAADAGSNRSAVSISATTSPRAVAAAASRHEHRRAARRPARRRSPTGARGAARRRAARRAPAMPGRRQPLVRSAPPRPPTSVSVTSSFRARSNDSSAARAAPFSPFLRLAGGVYAAPQPRNQASRVT